MSQFNRSVFSSADTDASAPKSISAQVPLLFLICATRLDLLNCYVKKNWDMLSEMGFSKEVLEKSYDVLSHYRLYLDLSCYVSQQLTNYWDYDDSACPSNPFFKKLMDEYKNVTLYSPPPDQNVRCK